jgi:hypothetical protein
MGYMDYQKEKTIKELFTFLPMNLRLKVMVME